MSEEIRIGVERMIDYYKQDRKWLKKIVEVYDKKSITVPSEFDVYMEQLKLYLEQKNE